MIGVINIFVVKYFVFLTYKSTVRSILRSSRKKTWKKIIRRPFLECSRNETISPSRRAAINVSRVRETLNRTRSVINQRRASFKYRTQNCREYQQKKIEQSRSLNVVYHHRVIRYALFHSVFIFGYDAS